MGDDEVVPAERKTGEGHDDAAEGGEDPCTLFEGGAAGDGEEEDEDVEGEGGEKGGGAGEGAEGVGHGCCLRVARDWAGQLKG